MRARHAIDTGLCGLLLLGWAPTASAFIVSVGNANPTTAYLRVGDAGAGTFAGNNLTTGGTINKVSVIVPTAVVGNGAAQTMATDTISGTSSFDGSVSCTAGTQLNISGMTQPHAGSGNGTVTVTTPANLTSGANTIPFTQISWTSSDTTAFASGTFTGGTQTVGTVTLRFWNEACLTFSYANAAVHPPGTYTGRATYTMTVP